MIKEIQVIGKGSKVFRELFGKIKDPRHSIFEGTNRLSGIARKNQLFDEDIRSMMQMQKQLLKKTHHRSKRIFLTHDSPLIAKEQVGPNQKLLKWMTM